MAAATKETIELEFAVDTSQIDRASSAAKRFADAVNREHMEGYELAVKDATQAVSAHAKALDDAANAAKRTQAVTDMYAETLETVARSSTRVNTSTKQAANDQGSTWERASQGSLHYAQRLQQAERGAGSLGYKLQVMAGTLDDLQYVGEMGLRPILNNLQQISPALAIFAIAGETVRKHWDDVKPAVSGVMEYWLKGFADSDTALNGFQQGLRTLKKDFMGAAEGAVQFFGDTMEGVDALSHGTEKRDRATIAAFGERRTAGEIARGKAVKEGLADVTSDELLNILIEHQKKLSPDFNKPGFDLEHEKARLIQLVADAEKGKPGEVSSLQRMLQGTVLQGRIDGKIEDIGSKERQAKYKEEQDAAQAAQDARNEAIDRRRKEKSDEIAAAMEKSVGEGILENTGLRDGDRRKLDANALAWDQKKAIAKHLKETGQAEDDQEANDLAKLIYDRIFDNTWKRIRDRVNGGGVADPAAAARLEMEKLRNVQQDNRERDREQRRHLTDEDRSFALRMRAAGANGINDQIGLAMMRAREQAENRLNRARNPAEARRIAREPMDVRANAVGRANDAEDRGLIDQLTKRFLGDDGRMVRGRRVGNTPPITDDPEEARAMAKQAVTKRRDALNQQTGDLPTEEQQRNTDAVQGLTKSIDELKANGIRVLMAP